MRTNLSQNIRAEEVRHMEKTKQNADGPVFAFNVTMQNHSSYKQIFDNFPLTLKVKDEEYNIQTVEVQSDFTLLELKGNSKELNKIFEKVIGQLTRDFNITKIESETYPHVLELIGDFQQKTRHGNDYLKLKLKISN